jgi:hypothetical protein
MKREATHRGGGPTCGEQMIANYGQAVGKILTKKKVTKLSKAKVKRIAARRIGAEAASEQLEDAELCRDLAGKFAREFAKKTGDTIGDVLDRYEAIALGFAAVGSVLTGGVAHPAVFRYSLSSVLRSSYQTDEALRAFLAKLDKWVRGYIRACTRGEQDNYSWTLCRYPVSRELLIMLADEYARDREALMRFLLACFKRWRKITAPNSLHGVRVVIQQLAARYGHGRKRLLDELQKRGVVPGDKALTASESDKWRYKIGQILRRDQGTAVKRGFGSDGRQKPGSFRLRRPSEFAVRRNVETR